MLESYPLVPVVGSVRIVVAIFSYDGGLYFGVTGDYDGAPDIDVLTAGIERGMEELLELAVGAGSRPNEPDPCLTGTGFVGAPTMASSSSDQGRLARTVVGGRLRSRG
jgi:hypothetical protein